MSVMKLALTLCGLLALAACQAPVKEDKLKTLEEYRIRQYVADAVMLLFKYRVYATQHVIRNLELATSNKALGLPEPTVFATDAIRQLEVLPDGSLMATLQDASGHKSPTVRFIPNVSNVHVGVQWRCVADIPGIETWLSNCYYQPR